MKDRGLEAFVEAIESHLTALRGTPHTLAPPDFALARGWHDAGVGLATVLCGIDRADAQSGPPATLAGCRKHILQLIENGATPRRRGARAVPPAAVAALPAAARLGALVLAVGRLPASLAQPLRERALALARTSATAAQLRELDDDVTAAALRALPESLRRDLERQAEAATTRQRGRVSEAALAAARTHFLAQQARAHFDLPTVLG